MICGEVERNSRHPEQKHQLVSVLVGLMTYQHPCILPHFLTIPMICGDAEGNSRHSEQKHQLVSFPVGLRTYHHPCIYPLCLNLLKGKQKMFITWRI